MTDYEAAFEDVMKYMPALSEDVDSQTKLKRFLRQNDRLNSMSEKFIEEITRTRSAEELVNEEITQTQIKQRAIRNREIVTQDKNDQLREGRVIKGTYTDKKNVRHSVFYNSMMEKVFEIREGKLKGRFRKADGSGRFAKK